MEPGHSSIRALLLSLGLLSAGAASACSGDDSAGTGGGPDAQSACGNAIVGACGQDAGPKGADSGPADGALTDSSAADSGPEAATFGCGNGPIGACDASTKD